jgi:ParB family chromosome partitioning protein
MNELIDSIQDSGILQPLTVRPLEGTEDRYEIISGHRRFHAAQKAGFTEIPAFIRSVSRDEAAIMLVDSNLHRERILPSEKAFAYKLKAEALNHQGKRTDLTSDQVGPKLTVNMISDSDSATQVKRYIRLTNLIPELLDLMDEGKIAFSVGVELSFLDDQLQYDVLNACEEADCTPSYAQAVRMRNAYTAGTLTCEGIYEMLSEDKANQRETVKIPLDSLKGRIPDSYNAKQRQEYILKACDHYHRYLQRQKGAR